MLHWLQSALPRKHILFLQICCVSLIFHLFIIVFSLIISLITTKPLNFIVHAQKLIDKPIYFMPLVKTINQPIRRTGVVGATKKVAPKKVALQKKNSRPVLSKIQAPKKIVEKPIDPKIKKQAEELSKKFLEKKKLFENFDVSKIPAQEDYSSVKEQTDKIIEQPEKVEEDQLILGREDLASLKIYESIQEEVSQHWKPPVGLSKDLECKIKAVVDNGGKIKNISIEQASGVLAYDMSVRMAFMQVQMPKEVFGKEVILTFRQ